MNFFGGLQEEKYDRQYDDRQLLNRLIAFFAPHRRRVIVALLMVLAMSLAASGIPILVALGIDAVAERELTSTAVLIIVVLLITAVGEFVFYYVRTRLSVLVIGDVVSELRQAAFSSAVNRDLGFYDETKSGKVVSRITSDTQEFYQVCLLVLEIGGQLVDVVFLFVVLLTYEWRLTLLLTAMTPIVLGIALVFRHFARIATRQGSRAMAAVNDNIQESVSGISVAKNFRREAMIYDEFVAVNNESYRINFRRGFVLALVFPVLNAVAGFMIGTIVYAGATSVIGGAIAFGAWYLFISAVDRFLFPFINIAAFWSQLQQGLSAAERIFGLIDAENSVNQHAPQPVPPLRGQVEFRGVTFRYKETLDPVLTDFDLEIAPGEDVAFVGHTGAGKSTIAKLITRFYEFQQGSLLIDGRDIRTLDMTEYRRQLGIVPQQPFLFSGTIRDNIRYARPEASDAEIEAVAHSIGEGEWLEPMPNGLDSDVGERGAHLSMGQRQLVSLLRVLVQKPAIFILDEATASIDPFTEAQIQEALELILRRSTSILIAHRLSTVRRANRIIVLANGGIIEQGSHEALMAANGHYAGLYDTYFRHQSLDYIEGAKAMLTANGD